MTDRSDCNCEQALALKEQVEFLEDECVKSHKDAMEQRRKVEALEERVREMEANQMTAAIAAAFIRDRAEQYDPSSGIYDALCTLACQVARGEPMEAYRHGELDDLLSEEPLPCDRPGFGD